jgi:glycosyltransferase involved in cell wall biosynthesis
MSAGTVTVAIPVHNAGTDLVNVLSSVRAQKISREVELLVVDSGSTDGSVGVVRSHGARVVEIAPEDFSHGRTRNLMMKLAQGEHVAFLSQDAAPSHDMWLANLIEGFEMAESVALVFGPYLPRPDASPMVKRELAEFFASFSKDGRPVLQCLEQGRGPESAYRRSPGPHSFFSDANGCVARWAWRNVPYRDVPYGEDQLLAAEMLEAGYAKVFHPGASVVHSHDYPTVAFFRRCFDEWRALREIHGHVESASPRRLASRLMREVRQDRAYMRDSGDSSLALGLGTLRSVRYHLTRALGSLAGSRADRLPAPVRRRLSLEGRSTFSPCPRTRS